MSASFLQQDPLAPADLSSPLRECEAKVTSQEISTKDALRSLNLNPRGHWFSSETTRAAYFCVKTVVNENAAEGKACRLEVFQNQFDPEKCFFIVYCVGRDDQERPVIRKQFCTNDPEYAKERGWKMPEMLPASNSVQTVSQAIRDSFDSPVV